MPKKIIFFFPPTGMNGKNYINEEAEANFSDDVLRIYLDHCGNPNIGNSIPLPNFNIVAKKIGNAFNNNLLDLETLKQNLGSGLVEIRGNLDDTKPIEIERIALQGYSRGAIAAMAVAKELDKLNVPIDVLADRPVPGQFSTWQPFSSYSKYSDLSLCKNIQTSTTLLAAHHLQNSWLHNLLFKQMLPKYSYKTLTNSFLIPYSFHFSPGFKKVPIAHHMLYQFERLGYFGPVTADSKLWTNTIKEHYATTEQLYFTPQKYLQEVFGANGPIARDPFYLEARKEKAETLLEKHNLYCERVLNNEQAHALCIIEELELLDELSKKTFSKYILSSTPQALKFIQLVNEVHEACVYLSHTNLTKDNRKSTLIKEHSQDYKKQVFTLSYDYLKKETNSDVDTAKFISNINKAQKAFETNALGIDRGLMRKILSILTNEILMITGACLIANSVNKALTGDWLFFSKTRSTKTMRETLDSVITPCINKPKV